VHRLLLLSPFFGPARSNGLRSVAVVISALDDVVDTAAATAVPGQLADAAGVAVSSYVLPDSLRLRHNTLNLAGRADAGEIRELYIRLYEGRR
jgi:hypothetical protein